LYRLRCGVRSRDACCGAGRRTAIARSAAGTGRRRRRVARCASTRRGCGRCWGPIRSARRAMPDETNGSENDLRAQLNLPRRPDDAGNRAGIARAEGGVRQIELRRIEDIEAFGAKLEPRALREAEFLEEREVEVHATGSIQDIPARIPVGKW